ncbi:hypothetical protein [Streptomyces sp. NBC_00158]|uniref:hypothetical protein n=1 Tax=Streptomyces sp. NBC_00158 TaxID=2903627 RepID=UPI0032522110
MSAGSRSRTVRFEDVAPDLAEDPAGEDRAPGCTTPEDADALGELLDGSTMASVRRLKVYVGGSDGSMYALNAVTVPVGSSR